MTWTRLPRGLAFVDAQVREVFAAEQDWTGPDRVLRSFSFRAYEVAPGPGARLVPAGSVAMMAASGGQGGRGGLFPPGDPANLLPESRQRAIAELRAELAGGPTPPPPRPRAEPTLSREPKARRAERRRSPEELDAERRTEGYAIRHAKAWLREVLGDGPVPASEVYARAQEAGVFSRRTLERAKAELGVWARRDSDRWLWHLDRQGEGP